MALTNMRIQRRRTSSAEIKRSLFFNRASEPLLIVMIVHWAVDINMKDAQNIEAGGLQMLDTKVHWAQGLLT